ncbi:hypothetical protein [Acetobacter fallax]|uniref:Phage protein n=1 Tax=Acetobacter fallax TaxID=1737473 RepID=A0ABX0KCB0_9PROT|nr:hypothetical protein [Acetobacter fallax]NHO33327.1 hypothetical protein [Acetobacter fallax]NHO36948.1 hypothetical protein [Acetobacter fallax]
MTEKDELYPGLLKDGNVVTAAWNGLRSRLRKGLPETKFKHFVVPPHASKATWTRILSPDQSIAVGFSGWKPSSDTGKTFRGDLIFPVFGLVRMKNVEQLYLGSEQVRGIGTFGLVATLTAMLHGFSVTDVGRCVVRDVELPPAAEWIDEAQAIVGVTAVFENVSLDDAALYAQADDFLRLGESWDVNDTTYPDAVLEVRGE